MSILTNMLSVFRQKVFEIIFNI